MAKQTTAEQSGGRTVGTQTSLDNVAHPINYRLLFAAYTLCMVSIMCMQPFLQDLLYDYSNELVRKYKDVLPPWSKSYLRFMAYLGDGDGCYFIVMLTWARGKWNRKSSYFYDTNVLAMSYLFSVNLNYLLKSFFHSKRPYFDFPELADLDMKDCAVEFGNPSGHCMTVLTFMLCFVDFHVSKHADYYKENRGKYLLVWFLGWFIFFSIALSRVYSGRHSLD